MAGRRTWSDAELAELARVGPYDRAGLAAFRARYPRHSAGAISSKLLTLRIKQLASETDPGPKGNPFPLYRFD